MLEPGANVPSSQSDEVPLMDPSPRRANSPITALVWFNLKLAVKESKFTKVLYPIIGNLFVIALIRAISKDGYLPSAKFVQPIDPIMWCVSELDVYWPFYCNEETISEEYCSTAFKEFSRVLRPANANPARIRNGVEYNETLRTFPGVFGVQLVSPTHFEIDVPTSTFELLSADEIPNGETCRALADPTCAATQASRSCVTALEMAAISALQSVSEPTPTGLDDLTLRVFPQHVRRTDAILDTSLFWLIPLYLSGLFLNLFNIALIELVSEKESGTQTYLTSWGVSRLNHFLAWLSTNMAFGILAVVVICVGLERSHVIALEYLPALFIASMSYLFSLLSLAYIMSLRIATSVAATENASLMDLLFNAASLGSVAVHNRLFSLALALIPTVPFFFVLRAIFYAQSSSLALNPGTGVWLSLVISVLSQLLFIFAGVVVSRRNLFLPPKPQRQPDELLNQQLLEGGLGGLGGLSGPLSIRGLKKSYDEGATFVLKGVDLTVGPGEIHCLIGGNGAGKTTLIHSILGLHAVDSADVFDTPDIEDMAVCLQQDAVWDFLTVQDHITFFVLGLANSPQPDELIDSLDLRSLLDQVCSTLSGGQKRRLSFLLAIVKARLPTTRLVVLDEPSTGIDVDGRKLLWDHLRVLVRSEGKSVLLTTHYLDEAQGLSDKVTFLVEGVVGASGSVAELQSQLNGGFVLKWTPTQHESDVDSFIRSCVPATLRTEAETVSLRLELRAAEEGLLHDLVARFEEWERTGVVKSFSVESVTLDNLFTNLVNMPKSDAGVVPDMGDGGGDATSAAAEDQRVDNEVMLSGKSLMLRQIMCMAKIRVVPKISSFGAFTSAIVLPIFFLSISLWVRQFGLFGQTPTTGAADILRLDSLRIGENVFSRSGGIELPMKVPFIGSQWDGPPLPPQFELVHVPSDVGMMDYLWNAPNGEWYPFAVDLHARQLWLNPTSPRSGIALLAFLRDPSISMSLASFLSPDAFKAAVGGLLSSFMLYMILALYMLSTRCAAQIFTERDAFIKRLGQVQGMRPAAYWLGSLLGDFSSNVFIVLYVPFRADGLLGGLVEEVPGSFPLMLLAAVITTAQLILLCYSYIFIFSTKQSMLQFSSLYSILGMVFLVTAGMASIWSTADPAAPLSVWSFVSSLLFPPYTLVAVITKLVQMHLTDCDLNTEICHWSANVWQAGLFWPIFGGVCQIAAAVAFLAVMERRESARFRNASFNTCTWILDRDPERAATRDASLVAEEARILHNGGCDDDVLFVKLWHRFPTKGWPSLSNPTAHLIKWAVRDLTLGVRKGEVLGLLGKNGAGKTTALSVLVGTTVQSAGYAAIWPGRRIGFCPQSNALWVDMSAVDHIRFYLGIAGRDTSDSAVKSVLKHVGLLGEFGSRKGAKDFSGGMRRRLCIAIALTNRPEVLILDEPTAGVDVTGKREIWDILRSLKSSSCSMVLTTHSMEEADILCSRISVLENGRLIKVGSPDELKQSLRKLSVRVTYCSDGMVAGGSVKNFVQDRLGPESAVTTMDENKFEVSLAIVPASEIIARLDQLKFEKVICEYMLQQVSLQDVILNTAETVGDSAVGIE